MPRPARKTRAMLTRSQAVGKGKGRVSRFSGSKTAYWSAPSRGTPPRIIGVPERHAPLAPLAPGELSDRVELEGDVLHHAVPPPPRIPRARWHTMDSCRMPYLAARRFPRSGSVARSRSPYKGAGSRSRPSRPVDPAESPYADSSRVPRQTLGCASPLYGQSTIVPRCIPRPPPKICAFQRKVYKCGALGDGLIGCPSLAVGCADPSAIGAAGTVQSAASRSSPQRWRSRTIRDSSSSELRVGTRAA